MLDFSQWVNPAPPEGQRASKTNLVAAAVQIAWGPNGSRSALRDPSTVCVRYTGPRVLGTRLHTILRSPDGNLNHPRRSCWMLLGYRVRLIRGECGTKLLLSTDGSST